MKKTFDAVECQRLSRAEHSRKCEKMTAKEVIEYLKKHLVKSHRLPKGARHSA